METQDFALKRILKPLDWFVDCVIVFSIIAIALLVFTQVLLRYVFQSPLMGIEELCLFPATWLYLGAAVKASSEQNQLIARVLEIFFKKKKQVYLLRAVAALIASGILIWLTMWGYDFLKYSLRVQKTSDTLFIPMIYTEAPVFIAFALMLLYTAVECIGYILLYRATSSDSLMGKEEAV